MRRSTVRPETAPCTIGADHRWRSVARGVRGGGGATAGGSGLGVATAADAGGAGVGEGGTICAGVLQQLRRSGSCADVAASPPAGTTAQTAITMTAAAITGTSGSRPGFGSRPAGPGAAVAAESRGREERPQVPGRGSAAAPPAGGGGGSGELRGTSIGSARALQNSSEIPPARLDERMLGRKGRRHDLARPPVTPPASACLQSAPRRRRGC